MAAARDAKYIFFVYAVSADTGISFSISDVESLRAAHYFHTTRSAQNTAELKLDTHHCGEQVPLQSLIIARRGRGARTHSQKRV
jgi:hypothetical protein